MEKFQENLAKFAHFLYIRLLFNIEEYNKESLSDPSYIFAPNHSCNLDAYIIWSLLFKDYEMSSFMYKEFYEEFPKLAKLLPLFNVYPITRNSLVPNELKAELKKLRDLNHSLVIFPQGRHVAPELMARFPQYHLQTIPLGAFYLALKSGKKILPIFIEPPKIGRKNAIIYGNPLSPMDFDLKSKNKKENMFLFLTAWLEEINRLYTSFSLVVGRNCNPYKIENIYTDASGFRFNGLEDPNVIVKYLDEIEVLIKLHLETGSNDLSLLGTLANISPDIIAKISYADDVYKRCLVKHFK